MIEMSTIQMTWIMWKSNNLHDINIMIDRFEKRHSLLNNMGISNAKEGLGIYSISNAKELWKLDAMISKLKKLRELLEDE